MRGKEANRKNVAAVIIVIVLVSMTGLYLLISFLNRPTPPPLSVSFIKSEPAPQGLVGVNATEYDFNVTVTVPTSLNFPLGKNATSSTINHALKPLLGKYDLIASTYPDDGSTITTAVWTDTYIVDGESTFSLYSYETFSSNQTKLLTNDLFDGLTTAMNGNT